MKRETNPQNAPTERTVSDRVADSIAGTDKPISAKRPAATYSLVVGAYPIGLAVILLIVLLLYALFR
jgi:hypothetical protein